MCTQLLAVADRPAALKVAHQRRIHAGWVKPKRLDYPQAEWVVSADRLAIKAPLPLCRNFVGTLNGRCKSQL